MTGGVLAFQSAIYNLQSAISLPLRGHAGLFEELFALLLKQIGEVGQRLSLGEGLRQTGQEAREGVERGVGVEADRLQAGVAAAPLGLLPERLRAAGQPEVVL